MTNVKPFDEIMIFQNGMVAVFKGENQVPKYQGRWSQRKKIILPILEKHPEIRVHGDLNQPMAQWEIEKYGGLTVE